MKGKQCCGFCNRQIIPPGVEPIKRGGLSICEDCETEFKNIFSQDRLTMINNLSTVQPSTCSIPVVEAAKRTLISLEG